MLIRRRDFVLLGCASAFGGDGHDGAECPGGGRGEHTSGWEPVRLGPSMPRAAVVNEFIRSSTAPRALAFRPSSVYELRCDRHRPVTPETGQRLGWTARDGRAAVRHRHRPRRHAGDEPGSRARRRARTPRRGGRDRMAGADGQPGEGSGGAGGDVGHHPEANGRGPIDPRGCARLQRARARAHVEAPRRQRGVLRPHGPHGRARDAAAREWGAVSPRLGGLRPLGLYLGAASTWRARKFERSRAQ